MAVIEVASGAVSGTVDDVVDGAKPVEEGQAYVTVGMCHIVLQEAIWITRYSRLIGLK